MNKDFLKNVLQKMKTDHSSLHKRWVVLAASAVFLVTLTCRLAYLYGTDHDHVNYPLRMDYWGLIAEALATGKGYSMPVNNYTEYKTTAQRVPIYPLFLAAVFKVTENSY